MRFLPVMILLIFLVTEAIACGLQAETSVQSLLRIAENTEAPATEHLPQSLISGAGNTIVKNAAGKEVQIQDGLTLTPGMTITAKAGAAKVHIPTTGQTVDLAPGSTVKILTYNKSSDQKICHLSFELQSGRAEFTSEHQVHEAQCAPTQSNFEVTTGTVEITPIGTKYNVDLNQAIAEANGEVYNEEEVAVRSGAVKIRLVKVKKSAVSKKSKIKVASNNDDFEEEKPIIVKAGKKAKIKKGKKDRLADIQIVYPEQ